jgi:plastocyanin
MKQNLQLAIFSLLFIFTSTVKMLAQGPYADTIFIGYNGVIQTAAYDPPSITVAPGDSVLFWVISTGHPTEQVTAGAWTSSPTVIPSAAQNYKQGVKVSLNTGTYTYRCQVHGNAMTGTIIVSNTTGINNSSATYDLSASPNPFNDQLSLNINVGNKNLKFMKIYDLIGKEVAYVDLAGKTGAHSYNVDTSNLRAGIYFCTVYSERGVVETMKLFKTNQ